MSQKTISTVMVQMEKTARSAIFRAGDLIRKHLGDTSTFSVENKKPFDYVTDVDRECETLIIDTLLDQFPDHHIMSEEGTNAGLQSGVTWIIDPIDGTTNFIHGFPFVAVSIAACIDREIALGLVLDPVRGELFVAKRGEGAYLNGQRIHVRTDATLESALIATGFPFRSRDMVDAYLDTFKKIFMQVSGIRRAGAAALDLAYLAAGRVDGFWETGLKPWDVAAGILLIEEAGGMINDFWEEGNHLLNGHIVAGTASIYPFLQKQAAKFMAPMLRSVK